jgi:CO/xanthine dehydrogenase FAD-binding subunit
VARRRRVAGGGTWLYSEPQPAFDTLIDLEGLGWPPLETKPEGLTIAATCRIAEFYRYSGAAIWKALPLIRQCCNAFLASFKIWNAATVGGNVCMSLPAGPMTSLTSAMQGVCTVAASRTASGNFVTGNHSDALRPGELPA